MSPCDSIIVVRDNTADRGRDLLLMRQGASGTEFEDFLTAELNESSADISPDGQWIAYQSDESGEYRIYVHSFPVITDRHSVSPGLGTDPVWSPDGRTLYYRSGSQYLAVDVTTEPVFDARATFLTKASLAFELSPELLRAGHFAGACRNSRPEADGSRVSVVDHASVGRRHAGVRCRRRPAVRPARDGRSDT